VLFLFAGKAHPADHPGQQVLREIKQLMLTPEFAGNVVFLEDYDMQLARWLVTGVDVWLNNPVAPLEASGTSGIKAAINGRLNVSILDGWWAEGFDHNNGWGISPSDAQDAERRDALDSAAMLDAIEEEVVPLYYARNQDGYSPEWVRRCKRAMMTVIPHFTMGRVVQDYAHGLYYPAAQHHQRLMSGGAAAATQLSGWKRRVREQWPGVSLRRLGDTPRELPRAGALRRAHRRDAQRADPGRRARGIRGAAGAAAIEIGIAGAVLVSLRPHDDAWRALLRPSGEVEADGSTVYELHALPPNCGQFAFEIRIFPWHEMLAHPLEMGLLKRL
jgi:starch phosphorylase